MAETIASRAIKRQNHFAVRIVVGLLEVQGSTASTDYADFAIFETFFSPLESCLRDLKKIGSPFD
jgi:hypothetical protein